jgi:hypothetical protein
VNLSLFVQLNKKWVIPCFVFGKFPPSGLEFVFRSVFIVVGLFPPYEDEYSVIYR